MMDESQLVCFMQEYSVVCESGSTKDHTSKVVTELKRSGWTARLLLILVAAFTLTVAGDALAGGKKDKKDKESEKGKKEQVEKKDDKGSKSVDDPAKTKKSSQVKGSDSKGQGSKGNSSKSQSQTKSQKKSQKRNQKRSCKRSSGGKR